MKFKIITLGFLIAFATHLSAQNAKSGNKNLPIGVFDSGTGGLTVLEAMLSLDAFNNTTGKAGADGKPDFNTEFFEYLADQANMPYGNYAAEKKTDLLKEHILKNMQYLLQSNTNKQSAKMIVLACNTATAYALADIKAKFKADNIQVPVIGVIDAGAKAALAYQAKAGAGTIGVFATAGTVASEGYPRTLQTMAKEKGLPVLSIVSQGGAGLAESIDRDWSYFVDTLKQARKEYKGPSMKNALYTIDTKYVTREIDDWKNDPANYVRYHLVTLLEKMLQQNSKTPMNTLILGCTHYPYMRDTIAKVLNELYNYKKDNQYRYRTCINQHVELIDPSVETAKEAYLEMRNLQLTNNKAAQPNQFFITIPNTQLAETQLQPDGWFTYGYKYGRVAGAKKDYVQYVPFDHKNISDASYERFKLVLPNAYREIVKTLK